MDNDYVSPTSHFAAFHRRTFLGILFAGIVTALITVGGAKLLNHFIIAPALCGSASSAICSNSLTVSFHIASLIAAVIGVALLVNLSVYRPLLAIIALVAGTWAMYNPQFPFINAPWLWQLGTVFSVNFIAILVFAWILRAYNTVVSITLTILITLAMIAAILL